MGRGNVTALTLLDLSAAFDTIDHKLLLDKLEEWFGIRGEALRWVGSYLSDRCQLISIQGKLSIPMSLICGVPQGSVLGPLLFILYMFLGSCCLAKMVRYLELPLLMVQW